MTKKDLLDLCNKHKVYPRLDVQKKSLVDLFSQTIKIALLSDEELSRLDKLPDDEDFRSLSCSLSLKAGISYDEHWIDCVREFQKLQNRERNLNELI